MVLSKGGTELKNESAPKPETGGGNGSLVFIFICLFFLLVVCPFMCVQAQRTWTVTAEGTYDHVVYGQYEYTHHSMSHRKELLDVTIVYFDDGRTCVLYGRHDLPFPAGTPVVIEVNGMEARRIRRK